MRDRSRPKTNALLPRRDGVLRTTMIVAIGLLILSQPPALLADAVSIPAAALQPRNNMIDYETNGVRLSNTDTNGLITLMAPLFLPQGAIIKAVTLEAYDNTGGEFGGYVRALLREYRYNTFLELVESTPGLGLDTTIEGAPGDTRVPIDGLNHPVDNTEFSYGFEVKINRGAGTANDVHFYKLIVEYSLTELTVVNAADQTQSLLKVTN